MFSIFLWNIWKTSVHNVYIIKLKIQNLSLHINFASTVLYKCCTFCINTVRYTITTCVPLFYYTHPLCTVHTWQVATGMACLACAPCALVMQLSSIILFLLQNTDDCILQAPLSEEFVFRACMLPLLVPSLGEGWAIFICPLLFGVGEFKKKEFCTYLHSVHAIHSFIFVCSKLLNFVCKLTLNFASNHFLARC